MDILSLHFSPELREDGEVFGILGMLFSVPVCAVLYSLYLEFMKNRTRHDTPLK